MTRKSNTVEFIAKANKVHSYFYSYLESCYVNNSIKVTIICPVHGAFMQTPSHHLGGKGCRDCAIHESARIRESNTEEFTSKARVIHKDIYSYSKVKYVKAIEKVEIICTNHGSFLQTPNSHLSGKGCELCGKELTKRPRLSQQNILDKCIRIHKDTYDYSSFIYSTYHEPAEIICKLHGSFWQSPANHCAGKGCPSCTSTGYDKYKAGTIYILQCENITKVGITNRSVKVRVKDINKSSRKSFEVTYFCYLQDGKIPVEVEKYLLGYLKSNYKNTDVKHDGYTECFINVNTDLLMYEMSKALCGSFKTK